MTTMPAPKVGYREPIMGAADLRPRDGHTTAPPATSRHRYPRDTLEFGRVVNLSDAVFAIALTLLVLSIERVEAGALVAFALAFLLVANVWWQHHRIVARLAWLEPGLIVINPVLLASLVTAVWAPLPGLGLLVVGSAAHALVVGRIGPDERRAWF